MDQITRQIIRIQKFVAIATVTKTALASRAGLPLTTLIGMEKDDWNPKAKTLAALSRAIDYYEAESAKKKVREQRLAAAVAA